MKKDSLTEDYVRDVARSAQAIAITDGGATVVAQTIGPFNRTLREAALELPFDSEPATHLLSLAPERRS